MHASFRQSLSHKKVLTYLYRLLEKDLCSLLRSSNHSKERLIGKARSILKKKNIADQLTQIDICEGADQIIYYMYLQINVF